MSQSLVEVGQRAIEAADARNVDAIFDVGAEIYAVCTNCHGAYAMETLRPNDARAN
jgi:mono/diheme cytochrome c family protein